MSDPPKCRGACINIVYFYKKSRFIRLQILELCVMVLVGYSAS